MKLPSKIIYTVIIVAITFSCGQVEEHQHEESQPDSTSEVMLNEGAPWKANTETTQGIANMVTLVEGMPSEQKEDPDYYYVLYEELQVEFDNILKSCTMTGEAHDQLHNYLMPLKEMFEEMSSMDLERCKNGYKRLNEHLAQYSNYFQ